MNKKLLKIGLAATAAETKEILAMKAHTKNHVYQSHFYS